MRIAFHTTLNAYDDGGVSGDRRMARQLVALLGRLGHAVAPVRAPRTWMGEPDPAALARHRARAATLEAAMAARWDAGAPAPELWFTYHHYYKAPDLLGPALSRRLDIPYVVAEASDAPGKAEGPWAAHVALARAAFPLADVQLCFTGRDRKGLAPFGGERTRFLDLPPFIDLDTLPPAPCRPARDGPPHLVAMAMMRPGNKHESYLALARALRLVEAAPWRLSLIGDGAMRADIERAFAGFGEGRVRFHGALDRGAASAILAGADLFVWPGLREAYGLVYLEAQAMGLPVVAFVSGGVPETVKPGETALLVLADDSAAFAQALASLIADPGLRRRMGEAASAFVRRERGLDGAQAIIARALALARANAAGGRLAGACADDA